MPETIDQWTIILKLAILWGFNAVYERAIDHLKDEVSPVGRVVLGQTYNLHFESWILPAMNEIMRRKEPISLEEGRLLGLDMALRLASVREQISVPRLFSSYDIVPGSRPNVGTLDFKPILRETFKMS